LRLHFEPKGKPQEDRKFYLAEKEDQCVVCGAKQNYIRKHVVPLEYRKLVAIATRAQTNVETFECLFVYVTFVSRFFATKHSLIVFMPDLCPNFM